MAPADRGSTLDAPGATSAPAQQADLGGEPSIADHRPAERDPFAPPTDPAWRMDAVGYNPAIEHDVESRFALGNGFLGVRASLPEPTNASLPRTFVAGLFDRTSEPPVVAALVSAPDWLRLTVRPLGAPALLELATPPVDARVLDFKRGVLLVEWTRFDGDGRPVRVQALRFVSAARRHLAVQVARFLLDEPLDLLVEAHVGPADETLVPTRQRERALVWRTRHTDRRLGLALDAHLLGFPTPLLASARGGESWLWSWHAHGYQNNTLARLATFARGDAAREVGPETTALLERARRLGARRLLDEHVRAWRQRWEASDVAVDGDPVGQRALRFAVFHLVGSANPEDDRVSVGARGLTGEAYLGHVFWDTEIFLLPFYTYTWPEAARAMLTYRYHTLPAARAKAERLGYRGALYAWESADTGEEETPPFAVGPEGNIIPILSGIQEHHISADVAYAVWMYWEATRDAAFLRRAGAEILLETARFWASRVVPGEDGVYHINTVIGPDEYHEHVDDNAYTNLMARWNLRRGVEVWDLLRRRWPSDWTRLRDALGLDDREVETWTSIAAQMYAGPRPGSLLVEQFAGYFDREDIDLSPYHDRRVPIDVLLGADRVHGSQVIKQADVLMAMALLPDEFDCATQEANFAYYEPRCAHGSSLSPATHALMAARLGHLDRALRYFREAGSIDLEDTMGNAALGVHVAALGGLWQAAVFGFAGVRFTDDGLTLRPALPAGWQRLAFRLRWRGRTIRLKLDDEAGTVAATLERGQPLTVSLPESTLRLTRGAEVVGRFRVEREEPRARIA